MEIVESLQKAIQYIEEHLQDELRIQEVAKQAHCSPYHFQRIFTILTGVPVGEYIRRRRLTQAAQELVHSNVKIIDLAHKYGYETPESFTKAFRKQHGITPSEARKKNGTLQSYNRLVIEVKLKGVDPMEYQLIEREAFRVIGLKKMFQCDDEMSQSIEINKMWQKSNEDGTIDQLLRLNNGDIKGMLGIAVDYSQETNELEYWIAAESTEKVPDGLNELKVAAAKWAVFNVTGPVAEAVPAMWKKIYSEWFPSNQYEQSEAPSMEVYKSPNPNDTDAQSEIWVPIK